MCNLWQEEGETGEKVQQVSSAAICDSLKSDCVWFADSCCLLAVVGLHRFIEIKLHFFCKANINKLERLTGVNLTHVFSVGILDFLWLWNERRKNWSEWTKNCEDTQGCFLEELRKDINLK